MQRCWCYNSNVSFLESSLDFLVLVVSVFVGFGFCLATPCSRQDLSFPARDRTCVPCSGRVES